jgi:hypothetical protein
MSKFSLEGLRQYDQPDFNVKELFILHKRAEVIARCKVQALETEYVVILVIGGERARITHCINESEVFSTAVAWKAELLAEGWHPADPPVITSWRSHHDGWEVVVSSYRRVIFRAPSGYYAPLAFKRDGTPPIGTGLEEHQSLHLAQMEIIRRLSEATGHVCSDQCTPWTWEFSIPAGIVI